MPKYYRKRKREPLMPSTEGHKKAVAKYNKQNCVRIPVTLNRKTDEDVLRKLDSVPSKQGYIKELIRQDIHKEFDR